MYRLTLTATDSDDNPTVIDVVTTAVATERANLESQGYRLANLEQPAVNDRVSDWRSYVVEQLGVPDGEAQALTKDELIALAEENPTPAPAVLEDGPAPEAGADPAADAADPTSDPA